MNQKKENVLKAFVKYYKPHKKMFFADMFCAFMIAIIDLFFPIVTRTALNKYIPEGRYNSFLVLMIAVVCVYLLQILFSRFVNYWGHVLGARIEITMRRDLFAHIQKMSFSFFDKHRTGDLISRISSDLFEITELAHHGPEDLFISVVTLVGALTIMFFVNWKLALILFMFIPVIVVFTLRQRKKMGDASAQVKEEIGQINTDTESSISGVRVSKAFTNEAYELEKFEKGNVNYFNAKKRFYRHIGVFSSFTNFLFNLMNLAVVAFGGYLIATDSFTLGDLTAFILYVGTFISPIRRLASFVEQYATGMAGFNRFQELLNEKPEIVDSENAKELKNVKGKVVFDDVKFSYDERVSVLSNINLIIPAGGNLALVGPSGGGKTTLCHLIPRFYEIDSGTITIDDQNIVDCTLKSLRENIGIVQQDVILFAGNVWDNIRYGKLDATNEEIVEAAKKAEIHADIIAMPDGYYTYVGERGVTLSGGQKQRISIARIFLKNPQILILDEATSALDSVTEALIQKALATLSYGRTTIVIAHRLSTIRNVDEIAFISDEGIVEQGSHDELMTLGGQYSTLYRTQFELD